MADWTLTPDTLDDADAGASSPQVPTGLAPTAVLPAPRRAREDAPPSYAPCPACRALVLTGQTPSGTRLHLDPSQATYVVLWHQGAPQPLFLPSRGYPVHVCHQQARDS